MYKVVREARFMGDEKRIAQRIDYESAIDLKSDDKFFTGFVRNISDGGLFVQTSEPPAVGTRLWIKFSLPTMTEAVHIETEVCWVRGFQAMHADIAPGMGLKFINLPPEVERAVNGFIEKSETLFYDED